jgi:TRAP-type C4-dicarboxylate transport system permease small subunit
MERFEKIIRRIFSFCVVLGSIFLLAMMFAIDGNVVFRMFGGLVPGSFELSELFIVVTASFALGYAALHKSHVDVGIVVEKLPERMQAILATITSFLTMATWAFTAWAGALVMKERWSSEFSEMLAVPFGPFRFVLLIGLILLVLVYLIDTIKALKKAVSK